MANGAGLPVGNDGLYGSVVRITPMPTVTEQEHDTGLDFLAQVIEALD